MKNKKLLILGAKGNLGSVLLDIFSDKYEVTAWDFAECDITDENSLESIKELVPDIIINATGYNDVDKAEDEGKEMVYKVNAGAVGNLAKLAKELDSVFVTYSTDYVFDGEKGSGYTEEDVPSPVSEYGKSKYEGEKLVREVCEKYYIIRPSWIFGVDGSGKKSFINLMLDLVVNQGKTHLDVEESSVSSPTYSVDLAKLTREIIEGEYEYGIYHGSNTGQCSRYEWAQKMFELKNIKVNITPVDEDFFPRTARRPKYSVLLNTKLPASRSWQHALEEYLKTI